MKKLLLIVGLLVSFSSQAQFWFGPKGGVQVIIPKYENTSHRDTFDITSKVNWHAGLAFDYSTEGNFEVHTEVMYLRLNNRTQAKSIYADQRLDCKTINHFLTAPIMARVVFMKNSRFKVFVEAGPRLSWWLGGEGTIISDETEEGSRALGTAVNFEVAFVDKDLDEVNLGDYDNKLIVTKPNRLQYALDFGVGWLFDISPTQRVIADAKVSFAHSNMAFNDGTAFSNLSDYKEDTEYRAHMIMISLAYMFGYDAALTTKGKSTSSPKTKKR